MPLQEGRPGTVALSVPVWLVGVVAERGWVGTGRTRDVRAGGVALELDEPAPAGVEEGAALVLVVDWGERHRHLARVARIDRGRRAVALMILKPESGHDQVWDGAVAAALAAG